MDEAEKASHTTEPWPEFESVAMKSKVCDMEVVEIGRENYNRARACVNACAGVTDGDLQQIADAGGWQAISEQWKQQRDELDALLAEFALLASAIATDGAEPDHRREYAKHLANRAESIAKHRGAEMRKKKEHRCDKTLEMFPETQQAAILQKKLDAAIEMIRDKENRYGIGSMCSQWTGSEIADDILERLEKLDGL